MTLDFAPGRKTSHLSESKSAEEVVHVLSRAGAINLLEIDLAGHEWDVLATVLDNGLLEVRLAAEEAEGEGRGLSFD